MQPLLSLVAVISFLATLISGLAADWQAAIMIRDTDYVDVRKEPNKNSPVVARIPDRQGTGGFQTKPSDSDWWRVKLYTGETGFVHRSEIVLVKDETEYLWRYMGGWRVTGVERPSSEKVVFRLESLKGEKRKFDFQQTFESDPFFVGQKVCYPFDGDESEIDFYADTVRWRKIGPNTVQVILRTLVDKKFISLVPNHVEIAGYSQVVSIRSGEISVSYEKGPEDAELESFVSDALLPGLELANKSGKKVASTAGWISTRKAGVDGENGKRVEVYH